MADKSTKQESSTRQVIAGSATVAAAIVLMISAIMIVLQGISALISDQNQAAKWLAALTYRSTIGARSNS